MKTAEQMKIEELNRLELKRKLWTLALNILLAVLITILLITIGISKREFKQEGQVSYKNYIVQEKETLFDIANKLDKDEDLRKTVNDIKKFNNLKSSMIYEGQVLKVEVK